ncbi:MAG: hypothetical protein ACYDHN_10405 [Solirubrobacteraceae bacterium]
MNEKSASEEDPIIGIAAEVEMKAAQGHAAAADESSTDDASRVEAAAIRPGSAPQCDA